MENAEIRKRILQILYEEDEQKPGNLVMRDFLQKKLNIPDNKLDANIRYLGEKGYIQYEGSIGAIFVYCHITSDGKDLVEDESEFNTKFPVVINQKFINASPGAVIADGSQNVNSQSMINSPGSNQTNVQGSHIEDKTYNISNDDLDWDMLFLKLGRKLMELSKPIRNFILIIPSILSSYIIVDVFLKFYLPILTIIIPILWFTILVSLGKYYGKRTCENCGKKFALGDYKPRKVFKTGEYQGSKVYNIKGYLKCHFCGFKVERDIIEESKIPSTEED